MAQITFWTLATGTMWLLLLSLPRVVETDWQTVPAGVFAGIAYLSVLTTILTFFAFQWSTTQIGPTRVAAYTLLNPAVVLVLGLSLGEDWPLLSTWPGVRPSRLHDLWANRGLRPLVLFAADARRTKRA